MAGPNWLLNGLSPSSDWHLKEGRKQAEHTIAYLLSLPFSVVDNVGTCDHPSHLFPQNR